MSCDSPVLNSDLCFASTATSKAPSSSFELYPIAQSARPLTRNLLFGTDRLGTSTDMVDSGYNLIGFFGVSVGTLRAPFRGVDGVVRAAVSALAGLYLSRTYFRHWIRMISIAIRQVASDCSS